MAELSIERLSASAFAPFGAVMDPGRSERRLINAGTTERFHALAESEMDREGRAIVSLFRGQPRAFPFQIAMMERHPLGSQAFWPLSGRPWLVAVAKDEAGRPALPRVFLARGDEGVNYRRNVWHHPLIVLEQPADFLVVDREGPGDNLEEFFYSEAYSIASPNLENDR